MESLRAFYVISLVLLLVNVTNASESECKYSSTAVLGMQPRSNATCDFLELIDGLLYNRSFLDRAKVLDYMQQLPEQFDHTDPVIQLLVNYIYQSTPTEDSQKSRMSSRTKMLIISASVAVALLSLSFAAIVLIMFRIQHNPIRRNLRWRTGAAASELRQQPALLTENRVTIKETSEM